MADQLVDERLDIRREVRLSPGFRMTEDFLKHRAWTLPGADDLQQAEEVLIDLPVFQNHLVVNLLGPIAPGAGNADGDLGNCFPL